jgi:hypothetical protein
MIIIHDNKNNIYLFANNNNRLFNKKKKVTHYNYISLIICLFPFLIIFNFISFDLLHIIIKFIINNINIKIK